MAHLDQWLARCCCVVQLDGDATGLVERRRCPCIREAVARYQVDTHDLAGLDTYGGLMKTASATTEDKVQFAREALRLGRPEMGAPVLAELNDLPAFQKSATVHSLRAGQLASDGRWQIKGERRDDPSIVVLLVQRPF